MYFEEWPAKKKALTAASREPENEKLKK